MNDKDIKKIIKHDFSSNMPDVLSKIDLDSIEIKKPTRRSFKERYLQNKFVLAGALSAILVLIMLFTGVGEGPNIPSDRTAIAFNQREEIYAVSAVSAVSLLQQTLENNNQLFQEYEPVFLSFTAVNAENNRLIDNHISTLNNFLNATEPLLNNKEQLEFHVEASELVGYEKKLTFSSFDLRNIRVEQVIHFNETLAGDDIVLDGIMIVADKTYVMEALIEIDGDDIELELNAYQLGNPESSVHVYQEIKSDKQIFEYELVRSGETIFESALEMIQKEGYIIIEIEYESETEAVEFEIERIQRDHGDILYINYEIERDDEDEEGFIVVELVFNAATNAYDYRYTITIDDDTYTYDKNRTTMVEAKVFFENYYTFSHLYILEINDLLKANTDRLFKQETLSNGTYSYERVLPIMIDGERVHGVIQYNIISDEDEYIFEGVLHINDYSFTGEGSLEIDEDNYELEVTFYDDQDETHYFEFYELHDDEYELFYTYYIDDALVFSLDIQIDHYQIFIELYTEDAISIDLTYNQTGSRLFSGTYEIEGAYVSEEGTLDIEVVYDEPNEQYYYQYNVRVNNRDFTFEPN